MIQYIVDAFTDKVFSGNPAAICILDQWIPEELMMKITCENNLSETAFAVGKDGKYHLRWFTPGGEINLCGHATLATAYVITNFIEKGRSQIEFETLSGILSVEKNDNLFEMDFPAYELERVEITSEIVSAIGAEPTEVYKGRDLLCVFDDENIIKEIKPDMEKLRNIEGLLCHVTSKGNEYDCVSRSFAPKLNVNEDPVCGSGHCHIVPYWAKKLGKNNLVARQESKRGGVLYCEINGNRVKMAGQAVLYSQATIYIE